MVATESVIQFTATSTVLMELTVHERRLRFEVMDEKEATVLETWKNLVLSLHKGSFLTNISIDLQKRRLESCQKLFASRST